jgi:hypothetical protein
MWDTGEPRPRFEERFRMGDLEFNALSDANGEYEIHDIPAGEYEILSYRPSGFGFYTPRFVTVRAGEMTEVPTRYFHFVGDVVISSPLGGSLVRVPFTIAWESYPGADYYQVQLGGPESLWKEMQAQDNALTIEEPLEPGRYTVWVRAMADKTILMAVESVSFVVE